MAAVHRSRQLASGLALLAVVVMIGVGLSQVRVDTGIGSFVPRGDQAYADLEQRDRDFGADPVVVVLKGTSQNGLLLDEGQLARLVGLEGELARIPDVAVVYGPGSVLNQTASSIRNVLLQMSGRRDAIENTAMAEAKAQGLNGAEAQVRVTQALAKFDERYGSLLTEAMPMGLPSLKNKKFVASVLLGDDGNPRPEWKFLAPTAKSATLLIRPREGLDQADTRRVVEQVEEVVSKSDLKTEPPLVTGVPVLTSAVSERAASEAPRLGLLAVAAVGLVFFLVPWSRRRRDRLRPMLAALLGTTSTVALFGWLDRPLSLGVVAFLPIVLGIGSDFPLYLSQPTHRRRVLVAALGGVLAFATLAISELPFVREFGLALALGVTLTVFWALVLRGHLREVDPAPMRKRVAAETNPVAVRAVAVVALIAAAAGWALLPSLQIESSPEQLARGLPELAGVDRAEEILGFSGEISVVVRGPDVLDPEVLAWSDRMEDRIITKHGDQATPLLTTGRLLDFLGEDPTAGQAAAGASLLPPYLLNAVVSGDRDVATSTFGISLRDLEDQQELIESIRTELPPAPEGYEVEVVGLPVLATSGLEAMSTNRYLIGIVGLVAAAAVVGFGLRSRRLAMMVACSSLLSAGWVYLGIKVLGLELNPLTLAAGALITVTACEFTVMLSSAGEGARWVRRSVAVAATAGSVGYLCLAASELAVLRDFGLVLATGIASSYIASRIVVAVSDLASRPPEGVVDETTSLPEKDHGEHRVKELM